MQIQGNAGIKDTKNIIGSAGDQLFCKFILIKLKLIVQNS